MVVRGLGKPRRVLIVSSHPLFSEGLRSLLQKRSKESILLVEVAADILYAASILEAQHPDLVILDEDDERINPLDLLSQFVQGSHKMRLVRFSLREGGSKAVIYDRQTIPAAQIDDWLAEHSVFDHPDRIENMGDQP